MMEKDEVLQAAEVYEKVLWSGPYNDPEQEWVIRAVCDVFANSEEIARHCPRMSVLVTLVDPKTGARAKASPQQLTPANPEMLRIKLQAKDMTKEK